MSNQFDSKDFEIVEVLDQNNFGKTCLVKYKNSNNYYYTNTFFLKLEDENDKHQFESYALKFMNLRHFSIHSLMGYSFYDFEGEPNPTLFYSRLLNLTKLNNKIKFMNNPTSNTEIILLFLGILTGLSFLHRNEIIIGDFNSDNIFINQNFYPFLLKIGYFNFFINKQSYPLQIVPPEFTPNSTYPFSKETDIYFFGIILFSIFSGKVINTILPDFPTTFDPNVKSLIKRCLDTNPQLRPNCDELFEWFDSNIESFRSFNQEKFHKYFLLLYGIPRDIYDNLTISNKKIFRYATYNDDESLLYVGKSFLFGKNFFPRNLEIGHSFLKKLNQKDNPGSLYYTGYLYETGKLNVIFKQDRGKAIEYYEKAAKMGSLASIEKLAKIYTTSTLLVDNEKKKKLIEYCKELAYSGNIDGLYILGTFYNDGLLVDQDESLAFDCFSKASDQGNVKAMIKCGMMLRYGIGVDINFDEALNFLSKAALLDPKEGAFQYACLLNDESATFCNKEEARKQFEIASQNGHSKATKIIKSNYTTDVLAIDDENCDEEEDDNKNYDIQSVYFDRLKALKGNPQSIKKISHFIYKHPRLEPDESSQMKFFKLASDLKDPIGQLKYGEFLTKSKKKEEIEKGIQLVKASADSGNIDAMNLYAFFNFNNNLEHKNLKESLGYYLKSAKLNSLTGLVNAGFILQNSEGSNEIQTDPIEAVRLFKKAAEMGNEIGLFHYGEALLNGEGVEQNYDEAIKMLQMASDKGDSDSMIELGNLFESGEGVHQNIKKALNLYKKAAEMNNSEGMFHFASLAEKYAKNKENEAFLRQFNQNKVEKVDHKNNEEEEKNDDVYKNELDLDNLKKLSIDYIKMAVDLENANAINLYGEHLLNGIGMQCNYELAEKYFKIAIENDNSSAMCNLGMMNETGKGLENVKNYQKAKELYEKAISSDETFSKAMFHVGLMKLNGHLYEVDLSAAENYFRAAVDDDFEEAAFALGWMFERGIGVEKRDLNEAFNLYKKAAANGSICGLIGLGKFYEFGIGGVDKNLNFANSIFNYAANQRGIDEIVFIGLCFENGDAAPKDLEYAELCFRIASNMNSENGSSNYQRFLSKKNSKVNK